MKKLLVAMSLLLVSSGVLCKAKKAAIENKIVQQKKLYGKKSVDGLFEVVVPKVVRKAFDANQDKVVKVPRGKNFEVRIGENDTAGTKKTWLYNSYTVFGSYSGDAVEMIGDSRYIAPTSAMLGAPGVRVFKFKALKTSEPVSVTLSFRFARSSMDFSSDVKYRSANIKII